MSAASEFPSDELVEVYTEGDCWALAFYVARLTGGDIYFVNGQDEWEHVVVQVAEDRYVDIEGLHTAASLAERWDTSTLERYDRQLGRFRKFQNDIDGMFRFWDWREARRDARLLVAHLDRHLIQSKLSRTIRDTHGFWWPVIRTTPDGYRVAGAWGDHLVRTGDVTAVGS